MRRRAAFIIALLLIASAIYLSDRAMKQGPVLGYQVADAEWVLVADDLGGWWKSIAEVEVVSSLIPNMGNPVAGFALAARKAIGIRPTPGRWNLWLGHQFVVSKNEHGAGLCLRPGILFRGIHLLGSALRRDTSPEPYFYRDGYLIVSRSREFIDSLSNDTLEKVEFLHDPLALEFRAEGEEPWALRAEAREGVPLSGWLTYTAGDVGPELEVLLPWSETSPISVAASKGHMLRTISEDLLPDGSAEHFLTRFLDAIQDELGEGWMQGDLPTGLMLLDVDLSEALPVPELMMVTVRDDLSSPIIAPAASIPYEWEQQPGWVLPWMGEKASLATLQQNNLQRVYSQERLLRAPTPHLEKGGVGHLALRARWNRVLPLARKILYEAAKRELVPRMNASDVERNIFPFLENDEAFGELRVVATLSGRELQFSGHLNVLPGESALETESP